MIKKKTSRFENKKRRLYRKEKQCRYKNEEKWKQTEKKCLSQNKEKRQETACFNKV